MNTVFLIIFVCRYVNPQPRLWLTTFLADDLPAEAHTIEGAVDIASAALDSRCNSRNVAVMPDLPMTLDKVNELSPDEFVAAFGDVAEHSSWVAEAAAGTRPFASRRAMSEAFVDVVLSAGEPDRLALIRAHPDLAGRAAVAGELAEDSRREQSAAGLDRLTAEEFGRFTTLNAAYQEKFRFPFIFAVKGADKHDILHAFEERLDNDHEAEFANAIRQVAQIIVFRIDDRVCQ